jgi:hypothetical protein
MGLLETSGLFGSALRTRVLILLALLEESYPRELARLLIAPLLSVQRIVNSLELDGAVVTRLVGQQRRVILNPRFYGAKPLKALLLNLAEGDSAVREIASSIRRRPRRAGKKL